MFNCTWVSLFLFISLIDVNPAVAQYSSENLFYMVDSEDSFQSFKENIDHISIAAPQVYDITETGIIYGGVDSRLMKIAKENDVKVMPLVMNPGFDRQLFHEFLHDSTAKKRAITTMVALAKKHDFYGWQFDFENIHISDRQAFTQFYTNTATALHKEGFKLSAAVVPTDTNFDLKTPYHRFLYEYWRGAYDLKALAEVGDFLSIMTYSQHTRRTPPGPVAGIPWMKQMIDYMLTIGIDPQKISLGIPFYSTHWFADYSEERGGFVNGAGASYQKAKRLVGRNNAKMEWMEDQQTHYAYWSNGGVFEYVFIEDARSLKSKLSLLDDFNLRGISVWRLGQEDPAVWDVIASDALQVR
jgi:spore germination protein YaaH